MSNVCSPLVTPAPCRTLPCVWNLVTAGFITTNPFKVSAVPVSAVAAADDGARHTGTRTGGLLRRPCVR